MLGERTDSKRHKKQVIKQRGNPRKHNEKKHFPALCSGSYINYRESKCLSAKKSQVWVNKKGKKRNINKLLELNKQKDKSSLLKNKYQRDKIVISMKVIAEIIDVCRLLDCHYIQ